MRDEARHGEHGIAQVIFEIYVFMADAARTGVLYATLLDPPPADPVVPHPPGPRIWTASYGARDTQPSVADGGRDLATASNGQGPWTRGPSGRGGSACPG